MTILQLVVLALVQGITEFLPISSSGHLILVPLLTDWPDQGILIDVAVHVGTLLAVCLYLVRELFAMARSLPAGLGREPFMRDANRRLIVLTIIASLPIILAGLALSTVGTDMLRSLTVIGWTMLVFGVLLYIVDKRAPMDRELHQLGIGHAVLIGLSQILALIPGTSRAGITMTASRALGYNRIDSARFSMLMSIPAILAAGTIATKEMIDLGNAQVTSDALYAGALAAVSALVAIVLMMRWLRTASFTPFVIYRCALGLILLGLGYGLI